MCALTSRTNPGADLFGVVGRFGRQLRGSAGTGGAWANGSARFTEAQSELLWLVGRRPGVSVRAAASEFGLAPNTTSTMVSMLVAGGSLIRTVDGTDRRACQLRLAGPAQQAVDASRAARRALLSQVLDELDDDQIEALTTGLAVLDTVARRLQER
ncbi:MarR family winged helix-turn-helix transcriptional regulator [Mycobacterium simiae]|uniref:MarR family winged helix-turn-helix transcriptional regulator n=1 Tax=Mycobacterium simiae TaxID=1784 RepID=UPI0003FE67EB|nr:MarR family winged helix-turn-helix transcriptional regulator [Mycobacterium simiae]PLV51894.1 MarR family transcriptional regulator [Mycobacterium tuberculosis variant microti OV254]BBX40758.1 MarR family transcriptional regulator [Mycobacterium simiae]